MSKQILLTNLVDNTEAKFGTYKELFQDLSGKDYIVSGVENGVIHTINGEKKPIDFSVGEVVVVIENTQANLIAEVSAYRDDLRVWAGEMKKQKLIGDEQLKKLAEQLAFLPKK